MSPLARRSTATSPARASPASISSRTRWASSRASAARANVRVCGSPAAIAAAPGCCFQASLASVSSTSTAGSGPGARDVLAARQQRREVLEALGEDHVDRSQHVAPAAEVLPELECPARRRQLGATRPEEAHVRVPETVDRLQLVPDREQVPAFQRAQDRELSRVGVLELVHHQQLEALGPRRAQRRVLGEQLARDQLEVVEVQRQALRLQRLVARTERVQQPVEERDGGQRVVLVAARPGGLRRGRQARVPLPAAAQLGVEVLDHRTRFVDPVGRQQVDRLLAACHEAGERVFVGTAPQPCRAGGVEDREIGVEPRGQRVGAQQAGAEAVEGADEGSLGVPRLLAPAQLEQALAHARAQLARGALGERDREHGRRGDAVVADGLDEALDEHRGLPAPGRGREQDRPVALSDGPALLGRELRALGAAPRTARRGARRGRC